MQQEKTELCKHGPMSENCRRFGCSYAHSLAELRLGALHQVDRYEKGLFCRFVGQRMCESSHRNILSYFDYEQKRNIVSPAWAHCYAWGMRRYHIGYRADLGDFGAQKDYDDWVWYQAWDYTNWRWSSHGYHPFPSWLTDMLAMRKCYLDRRLADPYVLSLENRVASMAARMAAAGLTVDGMGATGPMRERVIADVVQEAEGMGQGDEGAAIIARMGADAGDSMTEESAVAALPLEPCGAASNYDASAGAMASIEEEVPEAAPVAEWSMASAVEAEAGGPNAEECAAAAMPMAELGPIAAAAEGGAMAVAMTSTEEGPLDIEEEDVAAQNMGDEESAAAPMTDQFMAPAVQVEEGCPMGMPQEESAMVTAGASAFLSALETEGAAADTMHVAPNAEEHSEREAAAMSMPDVAAPATSMDGQRSKTNKIKMAAMV